CSSALWIDRVDHEHPQYHTQKSCHNTAEHIRKRQPSTPIAHKLECFPFEGRERRVAATEPGADERVPALVFRRKLLEEYHRGGSKNELAAHVDNEGAYVKCFSPGLRIEPPGKMITK